MHQFMYYICGIRGVRSIGRYLRDAVFGLRGEVSTFNPASHTVHLQHTAVAFYAHIHSHICTQSLSASPLDTHLHPGNTPSAGVTRTFHDCPHTLPADMALRDTQLRQKLRHLPTP